MFLSAPIVGRLARIVDARIAMVVGFSLAAWAIQLGVRVTDQWGFTEFFTLQMVRGFGTMMAMIAAQQMSIGTLPVTLMKDASGLINLIRNVAGAIGLAVLSTVLSHQNAVHYMDLASAASSANPTSQEMMAGLSQMMGAGGVADPDATARKAMSLMMHRKAAVLSFGDAFGVLSLSCWAAVFLAFFARPAPATSMEAQGAH
jgi:DHA2 family multidrug resistance protein